MLLCRMQSSQAFLTVVSRQYQSPMAQLYVRNLPSPLHTLTPSHPHTLTPRIVHEFIKKQEDTIEDEDEEGNSPLHLACLKGHHNTCKLLIKHLANVFAR